jgi:hypothetical protein
VFGAPFLLSNRTCCGGPPLAARSESFTESLRRPVGIKSLSMSRPLQRSFHLAMAARLCIHALADREALAPQDLAALLITLDLVSHSGGRLLFSSGGQLSAVTQGS